MSAEERIAELSSTDGEVEELKRRLKEAEAENADLKKRIDCYKEAYKDSTDAIGDLAQNCSRSVASLREKFESQVRSLRWRMDRERNKHETATMYIATLWSIIRHRGKQIERLHRLQDEAAQTQLDMVANFEKLECKHARATAHIRKLVNDKKSMWDTLGRERRSISHLYRENSAYRGVESYYRYFVDSIKNLMEFVQSYFEDEKAPTAIGNLIECRLDRLNREIVGERERFNRLEEEANKQYGCAAEGATK